MSLLTNTEFNTEPADAFATDSTVTTNEPHQKRMETSSEDSSLSPGWDQGLPGERSEQESDVDKGDSSEVVSQDDSNTAREEAEVIQVETPLGYKKRLTKRTPEMRDLMSNEGLLTYGDQTKTDGINTSLYTGRDIKREMTIIKEKEERYEEEEEEEEDRWWCKEPPMKRPLRSAPTGLRVEDILSELVFLCWYNEEEEEFSEYVIQKREEGQDWDNEESNLIPVEEGETCCYVHFLKPHTTYEFRIRGRDKEGMETGWSVPVSARTNTRIENEEVKRIIQNLQSNGEDPEACAKLLEEVSSLLTKYEGKTQRTKIFILKNHLIINAHFHR